MRNKNNIFSDSIKITVLPDDELVENAVSLRRAIKQNSMQHVYDGLSKKLDMPLHSNLELAVFLDKLVALKSSLENFDQMPYSEETLNRWVINYIQCSLVNYSDDAFYDQKQESKSYLPYHIITLEEIAKAYPKYEGECRRQIEVCKSIIESSE